MRKRNKLRIKLTTQKIHVHVQRDVQFYNNVFPLCTSLNKEQSHPFYELNESTSTNVKTQAETYGTSFGYLDNGNLQYYCEATELDKW